MRWTVLHNQLFNGCDKFVVQPINAALPPDESGVWISGYHPGEDLQSFTEAVVANTDHWGDMTELLGEWYPNATIIEEA